MKNRIDNLLYEEESSTLDFKKEQYSFIKANDNEKSELLKDILAFANAWRREDAYILIGIKEVKGGKSIIYGIDDEDVLDDASLQQFVNQKTQKPIAFEYKSITIDTKLIGMIKIPLSERPIYLKKDYGKLKKETVYIRRGSSTSIASLDEISQMGGINPIQNEIPNLKLNFLSIDSKEALGSEIDIAMIYLDITDSDDIDDYIGYTSAFKGQLLGCLNSNYYRELANYYLCKYAFKPISFCIYNDSSTVSTDIIVDMVVSQKFNFITEKKFPKMPESLHDTKQVLMNRLNKTQVIPDVTIEQRNDKWFIKLFYNKVQAKQTIYSNDFLYLYGNGKIEISYKIYADNLPSPIIGSLTINASVEKEKIEFDDLLKKHKKSMQTRTRKEQ